MNRKEYEKTKKALREPKKSNDTARKIDPGIRLAKRKRER